MGSSCCKEDKVDPPDDKRTTVTENNYIHQPVVTTQPGGSPQAHRNPAFTSAPESDEEENAPTPPPHRSSLSRDTSIEERGRVATPTLQRTQKTPITNATGTQKKPVEYHEQTTYGNVQSPHSKTTLAQDEIIAKSAAGENNTEVFDDLEEDPQQNNAKPGIPFRNKTLSTVSTNRETVTSELYDHLVEPDELKKVVAISPVPESPVPFSTQSGCGGDPGDDERIGDLGSPFDSAAGGFDDELEGEAEYEDEGDSSGDKGTPSGNSLSTDSSDGTRGSYELQKEVPEEETPDYVNVGEEENIYETFDDDDLIPGEPSVVLTSKKEKRMSSVVSPGDVTLVEEDDFDHTAVDNNTDGSRENDLGDASSADTRATKQEEKPSITSMKRNQESTKRAGTLQKMRIVYALTYYDAQDEEELSFKAGDLFTVLDDSEEDWWKVSHVESGKEGYIPSNYVTSRDKLQSMEWYFGSIERLYAERLLLSPENDSGTFLVRKDDHRQDCYMLLLRYSPRQNGSRRPVVKHYKIHVEPGDELKRLTQIIDQHNNRAGQLVYVLKTPCPKAPLKTWDLSKRTKTDWEIDRVDLAVGNIIGRGQLSDVHLGKWRERVEVAVKVLKDDELAKDETEKEDFLREAEAMKTCRHRNLVRLLGVCTVPADMPVYIIYEYVRHGNLKDYLAGPGSQLQVDILVDMAAQIASGMSYLESKKYVHRDLKAKNVLVAEHNEMKITDFGLARVLREGEYKTSLDIYDFPAKWTSPEGIQEATFTCKSDVWSYAVLLSEIFTYGEEPYPDMTKEEVIHEVDRGHRMEKPGITPVTVYQLMISCWRDDPKDRPHFHELHASLREYLQSLFKEEIYDDSYFTSKVGYVHAPSVQTTL